MWSARVCVEYIDLLWTYQNAVGVVQRNDRLLPPHPAITAFKAFLRSEWQASLGLMETTRQRVTKRHAVDSPHG